MSQYIYTSYGKSLATKHTEFIRRIISNPYYKALFDAQIRYDSKSKDDFKLESGGAVKAFGAAGAVTGQDAGLPNLPHFSGCVVIDDPHKPDEVHSDTMRQSVIQNYQETISQRPRGPNVPIIYIGQRLHEDDLAAFLMSGKDERAWRHVVIPAIDDAGNALDPEQNSLASLLEKKEKNNYVFHSQYQQTPFPSGGALFKTQDFVLLDDEPEILTTFITADTAETAKEYNDATVFSFWGIYNIEIGGRKTGTLGLHWLDCHEIRVEPRDLQEEFMNFFGDCMLHKVQPKFAAIEKKSTGVTLVSVLQDMRGLQIREVKRTKASGSKTVRYLEMQPIIASKQISLTRDAKHTQACISHMIKITANNTHRHDDLADTLYDACKIALIDKTVHITHSVSKQDAVLDSLAKDLSEQMFSRSEANDYGLSG
jgi:predicted phage terminase large subunit-like protein